MAVRSPSLVSNYTFATHTAVFHVCSRCGAVPVSTSEIDGQLYGVINVKLLADSSRGLTESREVEFTEETLATRLARRKRNWIANVHLPSELRAKLGS